MTLAMFEGLCKKYHDHPYSVRSGCRQANGDTDKKWKSFDCIISKFLAEQRIPGASVAISKKDRIIYKQGYGSAGGSRRVQPDSVFRIASISKPITAAVVLHICAQKDVSLDRLVFGRKGILKTYRTQDKRMKKISIRHLLQHSGGWDRDKVGDAAFVRPQCVVQHHPDTRAYNQALLSYALRRKLQFSPGTWHAYSNLGYLTLGLVIEELTGKTYSECLQDLLKKLGINSIAVGQRQRSGWDTAEVEYFNNKDPQVVDSLYPDEGLVLPQYGGMAMPSSAYYGGLNADTASLLQFLYCMETSVSALAQSQRSSSQNFSCGSDRSQNSESLSNTPKQSKSSEQKNLVCQNITTCSSSNDQGEKSYGVLKAVPLMSYAQAKETLSQPTYENPTAGDWYGLGWDVQDNGTSWGHTGGMEGTCGTLYHHGQSGLGWAFLLNAWAQDCDLNGVVKSGLMLTDLACEVDKSPAFPGFERLIRTSKHCSSDSSAVRVVTHNEQQIILLNITEPEACRVVSEFKPQGYFVTWLCCVTQQLGLETEVVTSMNKNDSEMQGSCPILHSSTDDTSFCQKYCLILTRTNFVFKDYFVMFNKQVDEIKKVWGTYKDADYCITFLDSFCWNSSLRFNAVFCTDDERDERFSKSADFTTLLAPLQSIKQSTTTSLQQPLSTMSTTSKGQESGVCAEKSEVVLAMKATEYIRYVQSVVLSHQILVQTVTEVDGELWVSALLQTKPQSLMYQQPNRAKNGYSKLAKAKKFIGVKRQDKLFKSTRLSANSTPEEKTSRSKKYTTLLNLDQSLSLPKIKTNGIQEEHNPPLVSKRTRTRSSDKEVNGKGARLKETANTHTKDTVYWVQITPESFLTELHRQIQRGRSLQYTKFYTVLGKPYVSAVWGFADITLSGATATVENISHVSSTSTCHNTSHEELGLLSTCRYHRTAMSKYGLLPELAEAASKNLVLQSISEYTEEDGSVYYAAIWLP